MDWIVIVGFIIFGIALVIIEVIFVPGTTIVGIGGFICLGYGIYVSFVSFGNQTGMITLFTSGIITIVALVISFKSKAWERFSLRQTMDQKVNQEISFDYKIGDEGETVSSLKPIGKGNFNDKIVEIRSQGTFIAENQKIKIVKIDHNKIFVEPIIN